jgi:hypothetical protein
MCQPVATCAVIEAEIEEAEVLGNDAFHLTMSPGVWAEPMIPFARMSNDAYRVNVFMVET